MAQTYSVFLVRDQIPERASLQAAIKTLGFKLTIEDDYVPFASSAYLPCTLDGEDAGFTMRFIESQSVAGKDSVMVLKSGGDPREEITILMIAAALANSFSAVVQDKSKAEQSVTTLIAAAKEAFAALD